MKFLALAALVALCGFLPARAMAQVAADRLERDVMRDAGEADDSSTREPGYLGLIGDAPEQNGAGVQVRETYTGGPADLAGIKPGDIILMVANRNVGSVGDLGAIMAANAPGSKLIFLIQRQDNEFEVMVTLGRKVAAPRRPTAAATTPTTPAAPGAPASGSLLGLRALPVTDAIAASLGLPRATGAVVTRIVTGSPAELAGIPQGAVIVAVDGIEVANAQDLAARVHELGPGKSVELSMFVDGKMTTREVKLGSGMPSGAAAPAPAVPHSRETAPPASDGSAGPQFGEPTSAADRTSTLALEQKLRSLEERLARMERMLEQVLAAQQAPAAVGEVDIDTIETDDLAAPK